jgi:hypothetical protein
MAGGLPITALRRVKGAVERERRQTKIVILQDLLDLLHCLKQEGESSFEHRDMWSLRKLLKLRLRFRLYSAFCK